MHDSVEETAKWLGKVVNGWLNYYAVPTSSRFPMPISPSPEADVALNPAPQIAKGTNSSGPSIAKLTARHWPKLEIRHPWPDQRFAVSASVGATPREEPDALAGLSGSVRGALGNQRPYRDRNGQRGKYSGSETCPGSRPRGAHGGGECSIRYRRSRTHTPQYRPDGARCGGDGASGSGSGGGRAGLLPFTRRQRRRLAEAQPLIAGNVVCPETGTVEFYFEGLTGTRQGGVAYARIPAARIRSAVSALSTAYNNDNENVLVIPHGANRGIGVAVQATNNRLMLNAQAPGNYYAKITHTV